MSVKRSLMKEIEASVARKKELAKEVSREKTIAHWVSEFFLEYEKMKSLQMNGYIVQRLSANLQRLDRKAFVVLKETQDDARIEIHWSSEYADKNNCEPIMVWDASSAHFQDAMEHL